MDDISLIKSVLDLTGFDIINSLCNIHCYCAGLGVGHKSLRSENLTKTTYNAHHVRSCNYYVEIKPSVILDLRDELLASNVICTCCLCLGNLVALCKYKYTNLLTCSVRENYSAADLLLCMSSVTTCTDVYFYGLIKFCCCCLLNSFNSFC